MRRIWVGLAVLTAAAGCADTGSGGADDGKVLAVASFYPLAQAVERIGGDQVTVTNLTPPGVEPHDLELTPRQVDTLEDADVVFYLAGGFQPGLEEVAERRSGPSIDLLAEADPVEGALEALEAQEAAGGHGGAGDDHAGEEEGAHEGEGGAASATEKEGGHAEEEGGHAEEEGGHAGEKEGEQAGEEGHAEATVDPHFWLDPQRLALVTNSIVEALTQARPDSAAAFVANAKAFRADLAALDSRFETGLADCDRREVVTTHAAFFYLASRYNLTQRPITGLSPESEADPARLAELADLIKSQGLTTVFYEELIPTDLAETLARETGATTSVLSPVEGLSPEDAEAGKDYFSVMDQNLANLRQALGCR
ncbi:MAG: metal ABC transporter substrate-binding protein [Acidimicrobiales bacterium]